MKPKQFSQFTCRIPNLLRRASVQVWRLLTVFVLIGITTSACYSPTPTVGPSGEATSTPNPNTEAMITFRVELPEALPAGDSIYLNVLDEVTGLALNQQSYVMQAEDATHFLVAVPFGLSSVIKYRYTRQGGSFSQEHLTDGRPVRYRMLRVEGPAVVEDTLSRWTDTEYTGSTGRISGTVTDADTGRPIPGILMTAGGAQTLTASDGSYLLEGLPPGVHNLLAYSIDGSYQVYQQGAVVAADSTTPAPMSLSPAKTVKVVFTVSVPEGTLPGVPLRIAGNLYSLGNTFGDLNGGISELSARMPVMTALPDGRYTITLDLPVGADIRYKYSLGDGLWNAEHKADGSFQVRQLIVPGESTSITDKIDTWMAGNSSPITFDIKAPASTPAGETVSIQFNPTYGWTEPMPMWQVEPGRWVFVLYSPLDPLGSIIYRFCRNDQCGSADDERTVGAHNAGQVISPTLLPQKVDDPILNWHWIVTEDQPTVVPNVTVRSRDTGFWAGVEYQTNYHPSWAPYNNSALQNVKNLGANWVIYRPTWTYTRVNFPVFEPVAGQDPLWPDLVSMIGQARGQGLNVALFPSPRYPISAKQWWQTGSRDFPWWLVWFERYRTFALNFADMASAEGAQALILGGEWVTPALPGGTLPDGTPSGVPLDAEARWRDLLSEVRQHYKGQVLWALPYDQGVDAAPPFLDAVDQVYIQWSAPLESQANATAEEMAVTAGKLLDDNVQPFQTKLRKPVILSVAYPSALGWLQGCLSDGNSGCLPMEALDRPQPDIDSVTLDLKGQEDAYNAVLLAVNSRPWIKGLVSAGYYPPAELSDKSSSVHGKPAAGVLWYWFPRFLGTVSGQ